MVKEIKESKKKTLSKVARFEIAQLFNEENRLMWKILKDLMYDSRHQGNEVIKCLYENSRFGKVKDFDEYNIPDKALQTRVDQLMKKKYLKANSSGIETTNKKVISEWNTNQKEHYLGNRVILSYRNSNSPLYVRNNQIKLSKDGDKYYIEVRLLSSLYAKELENGLTITIGKGKKAKEITYTKNTKGQWLKFQIIAKGNNKVIFDRCLNKEYNIGTSQFLHIESKNKWFFNLTYSFDKEVVQGLDENKIMGIDVGVNIPATLAVSHDNYYRKFVGDGKEMKDFEEQIVARKKRIQESRKWAGNGSVGHGTKTRLKALDKINGKITNFKQTKNHNWSRYIIDEAVRMGCGAIQMEDLSGISSDNKFLKTWTYYQLQEYITYKAEEVGIKVVKVKPNYTSQRCSKCGCINKENRDAKVSQEKFECVTCGYKVNADVNAARNIAMKDIEKIIEEQLKAQKKMETHNKKFLMN